MKELESFIERLIKNASGKQLEYYFYSNDNEAIQKVMDGLMDVTKFEAPDGYYYDSIIKVLYVFEHFEFDCSPRKRGSSKLRENLAIKNKKIKESVIDYKDIEIVSTNIIEQGYCDSSNGTNTYHFGEDGDKYRNNYINNFSESFSKHDHQIENYITNCSNEIKNEIKKVVTIFVVEDVTLGGTYYLSESKSIGDEVNLLLTKQFVEILENSKVDFVIFYAIQCSACFIFDRNFINDKLKDNLVDLNENEFFVFPVMMQFAAVKKVS